MSAFAAAHPNWCSPALCEVSDTTLPFSEGAHRSASIHLDLAPVVIGEDRLQVASASLWRQARAFDTDTYLIIESGGRRLTMPVLKSASVIVQLARLVGQGELA